MATTTPKKGSSISLSQLVTHCCQISFGAGQIIREIVNLQTDLDIIDKSSKASTPSVDDRGNEDRPEAMDPQTIADRKAEQYLLTALRSQWPGIQIVAEEEEEAGGGEATTEPGGVDEERFEKQLESPDLPETIMNDKRLYPLEDIIVWVDPLDGTKAFVAEQYHHVNVLIGISFQGRAIAGVMFQPFPVPAVGSDAPKEVVYGSTVFGIENQGVYQKIHHQSRKNHEWTCLFPAAAFNPNPNPTKKSTSITMSSRIPMSHFASKLRLIMSPKSSQTRDMVKEVFDSSNMLEALACGFGFDQIVKQQADIYLRLRGGTKRWDSCAGEGIIKGAGGYVYTCDGQEMVYSISKHESYENKQGFIASLSKDHVEHTLNLLRACREHGTNTLGFISNFLFQAQVKNSTGSPMKEWSVIPESWRKGVHSHSCQLKAFYDDNTSQVLFLKTSILSVLPHRSDKKWVRDQRSYTTEINFYHFVYPLLMAANPTLSCCKPIGIYSSSLQKVRPPIQESKYLLLLPDIPAQLSTAKQLHSLNFRQTKAALDFLAQLHAIGWNSSATWASAKENLWAWGGWWDYAKRGPEELEPAQEVWQDFCQNVLRKTPEADVLELEKSASLQQLGARMIRQAPMIYHRLVNTDPALQTVIHGDFKTGNLFFNENPPDAPWRPKKQKQEEPTDPKAIIIDWQWSGIGLAAMDVGYLFVTSVDLDTLEKETSLMDDYYHTLAQALEAHHQLDIVEDLNYTRAMFQVHVELSQLEYARIAISCKWKGATLESYASKKNELNNGLVYRSIPHAIRLIQKMDQWLDKYQET